MTKEKAIEKLKFLLECNYVDTFEDEENEALEMAISALSENKTQMIDKSNFDEEQYKTDLQSAYDCGYKKALSENKGEWIPVSERLPEDGQSVNVTIQGNRVVYVTTATWDEMRGHFYNLGLAFNDVVAWCELPEPYKKGGE